MVEETIKLDPKEETRKLLKRLMTAVSEERMHPNFFDDVIRSCTEDLELIWSGHDTGSRWTISNAELRQAFVADPELGLDATGKVYLKEKKIDG